MTERIKLPDPACGSICKHSMSERCVEVCAPKGEMENLEVRGELTIDRMPGYEIREDLSWRARFRLQEAYTKKAVDFIQGRKDAQSDYSSIFPGRSLPNSSRYHEDNRIEAVNGVPEDTPRNDPLQVREESAS